MPTRTKILLGAVAALVLAGSTALLVYRKAAALTHASPAGADFNPELNGLIGKIESRLTAGGKTAAEFAPELGELDALFDRRRATDPEEASQILALKASLYLELHDVAEGRAMLLQIQREFPATALARDMDEVLRALDGQAAAEKARTTLVTGAVFPDFAEKDTAGRPLSVSAYRGKVVLVDFWATWCGPCVAEVPNVVKTYGKYHARGFDIIGVSLDQKGDAAVVAQFTKKNGMPWAQYFDGGYWQNKLAVQYGVNSIPATYLLDREGRIIGSDLRGAELDAAVAAALAR